MCDRPAAATALINRDRHRIFRARRHLMMPCAIERDRSAETLIDFGFSATSTEVSSRNEKERRAVRRGDGVAGKLILDPVEKAKLSARRYVKPIRNGFGTDATA